MEIYNRVVSGELAGSISAAQMPNIICRAVIFTALKSNAGNVYIGGAEVTKPDGTTDTTSGLELAPGTISPWFYVQNMSKLYYICDNALDDLTYVALG